MKSIYKILNFREINANKFAIVWAIPIFPKIIIFMWLVFNNRILTKYNLRKRGWTGILTCHFCTDNEDTNNLFLKYPQAQKIWFWLGQSQEYLDTWSSCTDIFEFVCQLSYVQHLGFLVIFSAMCWMI